MKDKFSFFMDIFSWLFCIGVSFAFGFAISNEVNSRSKAEFYVGQCVADLMSNSYEEDNKHYETVVTVLDSGYIKTKYDWSLFGEGHTEVYSPEKARRLYNVECK